MNTLKKLVLIVILSLSSFVNLRSETITKNASIDGQSPDILATEFFIKGNDASSHGDFKTAVKFFRDMIALQPQNNYIKSKLAIELIRSGELSEAEKILETLISESQILDEPLRAILAGLYVALEKPDKARILYNEILTKGTDIEEACIFFAKYFSNKNRYSQAHAVLAKCEQKSKGDPIYAFYRGKIEFERGNNKESEKYFRKSLKIDHTFGNAVLALGAIYEQNKNLKKSVKTYTVFLATEGNSKNILVLSHLVTLMFSMEENLAVIPYAEALNEISNRDVNLKIRLGFLYSDAGRYSDAISTFRDALVMQPDSAKICYYLGVVHQQAKLFDDAIKFFKRIPISSELFQNAEKKIKQLTNNLSLDNVQPNLWALLLKELNSKIKQ
jgi:tetratricopeptide (TPR) repeat protein